MRPPSFCCSFWEASSPSNLPSKRCGTTRLGLIYRQIIGYSPGVTSLEIQLVSLPAALLYRWKASFSDIWHIITDFLYSQFISSTLSSPSTIRLVLHIHLRLALGLGLKRLSFNAEVRVTDGGLSARVQKQFPKNFSSFRIHRRAATAPITFLTHSGIWATSGCHLTKAHSSSILSLP